MNGVVVTPSTQNLETSGTGLTGINLTYLPHYAGECGTDMAGEERDLGRTDHIRL